MESRQRRGGVGGGGAVREEMERNKNTDCGRRRRRGSVSPRHLLTDNLTNSQFHRCGSGSPSCVTAGLCAGA